MLSTILSQSPNRVKVYRSQNYATVVAFNDQTHLAMRGLYRATRPEVVR